LLDLRAWGALMRPALVVSLSSGVATLYAFTTQIVTSLVADPVQTGLFAASLRVFGVIASVPGLMVTSALPLLARAARDDSERLQFALRGLFDVALIAGVGVGVLLVVGAEPIIAVIGGPSFSGAVAPLRIEGAAVLGTCLTPVWSTGLLALHRHSAQLICNLIGLTVIVALTLALAPSLGARGAALATVAGEWTVAIALLIALARADRRLLPKAPKAVLRVAIAGGIALATLLLPVAPIVQLALSALVYAALIIVFGVLPRELLELVPGRSREKTSNPRTSLDPDGD
jgi:O-antigen/teichoic acid export membrane protein